MTETSIPPTPVCRVQNLLKHPAVLAEADRVCAAHARQRADSIPARCALLERPDGPIDPPLPSIHFTIPPGSTIEVSGAHLTLPAGTTIEVFGPVADQQGVGPRLVCLEGGLSAKDGGVQSGPAILKTIDDQ